MKRITPEDGGPAFPRTYSSGASAQLGMSLRDYFAGCALRGLTANGEAIAGAKDLAGLGEGEIEKYVHGVPTKQAIVMANWCYGYADALLAASATDPDPSATQLDQDMCPPQTVR